MVHTSPLSESNAVPNEIFELPVSGRSVFIVDVLDECIVGSSRKLRRESTRIEHGGCKVRAAHYGTTSRPCADADTTVHLQLTMSFEQFGECAPAPNGEVE